jgi:acyl carrier protein
MGSDADESAWARAHVEGIMEDVETKVTEVLLEILDIKPNDVVPTARFVEDLQATSIDLVEIVAVLQNAFDVDIDDAQVARLRTVQDTLDLFQAAMVAKRGTS